VIELVALPSQEIKLHLNDSLETLPSTTCSETLTLSMSAVLTIDMKAATMGTFLNGLTNLISPDLGAFVVLV